MKFTLDRCLNNYYYEVIRDLCINNWVLLIMEIKSEAIKVKASQLYLMFIAERNHLISMQPTKKTIKQSKSFWWTTNYKTYKKFRDVLSVTHKMKISFAIHFLFLILSFNINKKKIFISSYKNESKKNNRNDKKRKRERNESWQETEKRRRESYEDAMRQILFIAMSVSIPDLN